MLESKAIESQTEVSVTEKDSSLIHLGVCRGVVRLHNGIFNARVYFAGLASLETRCVIRDHLASSWTKGGFSMTWRKLIMVHSASSSDSSKLSSFLISGGAK